MDRSPPPCVIHEDADLLVVHKPPGWNTHAPSPHAGEGIYEWLRHREPRWASLAIVHRLDKDTSGLLVFARTPRANRSLTAQFAGRLVRKRYQCVTDRRPQRDVFSVRSGIVRSGGHYEIAAPGARDAAPAETRFRVLRTEGGRVWLEAVPLTGRTHQIRVHAASEGVPILGDRLYGGTPAARLHLHAWGLALDHPGTGRPVSWEVAPAFDRAPAEALRAAMVAPGQTTARRTLHGAADGVPGFTVERLGDWILVEGEGEVPQTLPGILRPHVAGAAGIYFKARRRLVRGTAPGEVSPRFLEGIPAPTRFEVRENGLRFELSLAEGYSTGLFLDQRDNRRRLQVGQVAAGFPLRPSAGVPEPRFLNTFAYTCAFSVAAAVGGWRTTSLDLSRKYLDWGRRNFELNGLDAGGHEFIHGDVFDWLHRFQRRSRRFDVVMLDPPTFSRSREHGDFRAESDYGALVAQVLPVLAPGGVLFASTNAGRMPPDRFLEGIRGAIASGGRRVTQQHYAPQPPDFPITREEPAHLKTVWIRLD